MAERKVWQEQVYRKLKAIKKKQTVHILKKEIIVLPGLSAPIFDDAKFFAQAVKDETKRGDIVLDLGTGSGIQGIFTADKASKVISVDINPAAIKCAELNARHHCREDKITIFASDLFSNINEKFDLIIFNPPFRWFRPRDMMEKESLDENYGTLTKFFKEAKGYLKEKGRILLIFSSSGDLRYLKQLITKSVFSAKIVRRKILGKWTYVIFRLSLN